MATKNEHSLWMRNVYWNDVGGQKSGLNSDLRKKSNVKRSILICNTSAHPPALLFVCLSTCDLVSAAELFVVLLWTPV